MSRDGTDQVVLATHKIEQQTGQTRSIEAFFAALKIEHYPVRPRFHFSPPHCVVVAGKLHNHLLAANHDKHITFRRAVVTADLNFASGLTFVHSCHLSTVRPAHGFTGLEG